MNCEHRYLSLELHSDESFAIIKRLPGVPYSYMLREGVSLSDVDFPAGLEFPTTEDSGSIIGDSVDNIFSAFFISSALKDFLCSIPELDDHIQYLPFAIVNAEGHRLPGDYYLANVLPSFDCFDTERGGYKRHPKTGKVWRISTIEVTGSKIPSTAMIFRLGEDKARIIFRSDLVDAIKANGFTGLSVYAMGATLP